MSHGAMVFVMMIPVTTVVIIGTYLLYKQLSVFIIRLCKKVNVSIGHRQILLRCQI